MIKVLIVDDSPFIRRILTDIFNEDDMIYVVGHANNGKEALDKIPLLKPDIITLDIEMPIMGGIATLDNIIKSYNIPVIIISNLTKEGAVLTLEALEKGAIDFIPKPHNIFSLSDKIKKQEIINKIKIAAKFKTNIDYIKNSIFKPIAKSSTIMRANKKNFDYIIALGTSTGGPRALQEVLPLLPADINASIVVVQHMPPKFTKSLADRLNNLSKIEVKEGEEGDRLKRGYCYIAPGDYHMEVVEDNSDYIIQLNKEPAIKGLRPSVDILMESVAKLGDLKKVGIVMTGMGSDGANGIVQIKKSKGFTIAQDKDSSIIFGMPKAAIDTRYIDKIVPLNSIAHEIMSVVGV
ncbi:protein-glutamate methylesterase/protein-glutamine glutaminase [Clostridium sp. Cult2]|uniref:protein-glutamate methylesterase/protein-glutamine glutaminase n=1 Tax=Clostridium sp. Cult2 TaxID=2079003 RepID=UPI001F2E5CD3|nr:chemotaxis response regulator protein-glutamate methylesterase [Clostridium sp. Cult2]MCF6464716.1 chemotaxis response regulator protein-glutamate methylesterase [Clostridium sp. Cult2]